MNPAETEEVEKALHAHIYRDEELYFTTTFLNIGTSLFDEYPPEGFIAGFGKAVAKSGPTGVALTSKRIVRAQIGMAGFNGRAAVTHISWSDVDRVQFKDDYRQVSLRLRLKDGRTLDFDSDGTGGRAVKNLHEHLDGLLRTHQSDASVPFDKNQMIACLKEMHRLEILFSEDLDKFIWRVERYWRGR